MNTTQSTAKPMSEWTDADAIKDLLGTLEKHQGTIERCARHAKAVRALLSAQSSVKVEDAKDAPKLEWSDELSSTSEVPYNHVIADTPFGRILITWKGWKEYPDPTVDEHPVQGFFYIGGDLNDAKQAAEKAYFAAIAAQEEKK